MPKFGIVPTEVPVQRTWNGCAPAFVAACQDMLKALEGGPPEWPFETLRTNARQSFLHGFGRKYDDGRGRVTNAATAEKSWHFYGLAVDIVEKDATPWNVPVGFWNALGEAAENTGRLAWGGRWAHPDLPHIYWALCPATPTDDDVALYLSQGVESVWRKYHAL